MCFTNIPNKNGVNFIVVMVAQAVDTTLISVCFCILLIITALKFVHFLLGIYWNGSMPHRPIVHFLIMGITSCWEHLSFIPISRYKIIPTE